MGLVENTLGIQKPKTNLVFQDEPGFSKKTGLSIFLLLQRKPGEESKDILGVANEIERKANREIQGNPRGVAKKNPREI